MSKYLHIVTGPPGAGKSTFIEKRFPGMFKFGSDMKNKEDWPKCPESCVLETAAPSKENKEYWIKRAIDEGFIPQLYVLWVDFWVAHKRMKARSGLVSGQRNNLEKGIQRWYNHYSAHQNEQRINNG